ncbi:MAG: hypothetical protein LCH53_04495 [Bacteroidetes bacterium]|nr:hypothetical protein [Bacteroidota bacterium]
MGTPATLPVLPRGVARPSSASVQAAGQRLPDVPVVIERSAYPGLTGVIDQIKRNILAGRADDAVRAAALNVTESAPRDPRTPFANRRDFDALAVVVYRWMVENVQYVRDPFGMEQLQTASVTLRRRSGDCDDHTTLGGALLGSLGIPVRVRVVGAGSQPSHIFLEYRGSRGWTAFDTTLAQAPGALAARAFAYDRTYDLEPGHDLGDAELGLRVRDDLFVFDSPPVRGVDENAPIYEAVGRGGTGGAGSVRMAVVPTYSYPDVQPLPGGATTTPYVKPTTTAPGGDKAKTGTGGTSLSPGGVLDRVSDAADTVADILRRAREAYAAATAPASPPPVPENPTARTLSGLSLPLLALGGAGFWFLTRKRS